MRCQTNEKAATDVAAFSFVPKFTAPSAPPARAYSGEKRNGEGRKQKKNDVLCHLWYNHPYPLCAGVPCTPVCPTDRFRTPAGLSREQQAAFRSRRFCPGFAI